MAKRLFLLLTTSLLFVHALCAQNSFDEPDNGDFFLLPETIVTASRETESALESPYSVDVVTNADLLRENYRTLPDALFHVPGVMIQKTTHGHGSPFIRGFTGRRNLLLVDGIRMNNSTWRAGPIQYWNTVDSRALDRLELVKSQGSVLYGSDAIGGTVNALTRSTGFHDKDPGWFFHGDAFYSYNTNSRSHLSRLEQRYGQGGKWGLLLGISLNDFGDIKDSALGRMEGTGYDEETLDFKFEYALSSSSTLTLAHQYLNQDDVIRWHSTVLSDPDGDGMSWRHGSHFTTAGDNLDRRYDQERSLTYLRLREDAAAPDWINFWEATLSFQDLQDSQHRVRASGRVDDHIIDTQTYGLTLKADSNLAGGTLLYGLDYYHDEVESDGYRNGAFRAGNRPVADDATYDTLGFYTRWEKSLTDRLTAVLGARYTHIETEYSGYRPDGADADQPGEGSWDDLSFSLRARYEAADQLQFHAGISQAFRAPNLDDLTGTQLALSGLTTKGSPNVDPESYLTAEIGARYHLHDTLSLSAAAYYTRIDEPIIRVDDGSGDLVTTNGGEGYVFGAELEVAWRFMPDWELSAFLAWQDGKLKQPVALGGPSVSETIHRLHPFHGGIALSWDATDRFRLQARLTGAAGQDNLNSLVSDSQRIPSGGTPGYLTASLGAQWQATESFALGLTLDNLTDEDYRVHGSGLNSPGRAAILSARFSW